jgi:acyl carrier protein
MNYSPSHNEDIVKILSSYFSQRGSFLSKVILADIKSNQGKFSQITQKKQLQPQKLTVYTQNSLVSERDAVVKNTNSPTLPQNKPSVFVDPTLPSLEKELIKLVAQQTGFPESSLDLEARLLDDLNLDSIKGGELIAEFAKKFDLAGVIDPTTLGNASLREIVAVVQQHQQVLLPPIEPLKPENPQQSKEVDISQLLWQLIEEQTGFPRQP